MAQKFFCDVCRDEIQTKPVEERRKVTLSDFFAKQSAGILVCGKCYKTVLGALPSATMAWEKWPERE